MTEARGVIVHQGALGDFLLALPVIEGLHRASPEVKFDFWSHPAHLSLIHGKPYLISSFDSGGSEWMPFYEDTRWQNCPLPRGVVDACYILVFGQASSGRRQAFTWSSRKSVVCLPSSPSGKDLIQCTGA